jgi:thiamine-phosphate pyrophosphorylase
MTSMTAKHSSLLYLITPALGAGDLDAFAPALREALAGGRVASVLARVAPGSEVAAKKIVARLLEISAPAGVALLVENDARLAARAGADGVHVSAGGAALSEALASLKPERIVGAGLLRSRDDAMSAGEAGADYVMFGEPRQDGYTPPAQETLERVAWWAEIFEPPCVGYAARLEDVGALAAAGADFIALGDAIWLANSPKAALADAAALRAHAAG